MTTNNSILFVNINKINDSAEVWRVITDCKKSMSRVSFNFAVAVAYALGDTIPSYVTEDGEKVEGGTYNYAYENASALADAVGMNRSTISKVRKAFKWVVDGGYFEDFASGKYWFNFDKIYYLTDRERTFVDGGYKLEDLFMDSMASLKIKYAKLTKKAEDARATNDTLKNKNTASASQTDGDEDEVVLPSTSISFKWDGNTYTCKDADAIKAFITAHCEMV